ncbi:hypothetical protein HXX76_007714 [Chlamydomonas incerta]|uniref:MYND-type domain-containing protein n=1 Tax=Chlamydomonas incerta TaxID=51695 RepID=A0A835SX58_CHLIN|nr:hypothetical protein HXX76_007714 [Chlamydomonas incerta]|eukprot:KAG2434829.1 hypothetical protein HXX76_007714 [Chlamydomonas incerta]
MPPRARQPAAQQATSLLPFASLLAGSAEHGPSLTNGQLEDTLEQLTKLTSLNIDGLDQEPLVVNLVALFGLALRRSVPAPAPTPRAGAAGPGPSTSSGSSSTGAASSSGASRSSSSSAPYLTDETRQLYKHIRSRLCRLLLKDFRSISTRLCTLLFDLLLRTHVLRCYSSLLSTYTQLLRTRPSRRNLEGADDVVLEAQVLLVALAASDLVAYYPHQGAMEEQRSKPAAEKPHPNIAFATQYHHDCHVGWQLGESQLPEAWAACLLQLAACQTMSQAGESALQSVLAALEILWPKLPGRSRDILAAAPALQTLMALVTVRSLAALDGGSSYGQAAAARAAQSEDRNWGPPWTMIRAPERRPGVSLITGGGASLAPVVWGCFLRRRQRSGAAAAAASGVVGPAAAAGLAEDWARGPGSLPRPGLEQLRAQEAEVKRLEAARREVYRSLQAADEARQQQQQQAGASGSGSGAGGHQQQRGAGARQAQGQAKGRGGAAGKSQAQAQVQAHGEAESGAGASSSSQAAAMTSERRAELESQAAALTAELRQARRLAMIVPPSKHGTFTPLESYYTFVTLNGAQHALHTGDPALRYGPPGWRVHFSASGVTSEAFVEDMPGQKGFCYMRPYMVARALAATLRSRGVVLPVGLEALLEEAPEAINADDLGWMETILKRAGKQPAPRPTPTQLALPPWDDAATFDVCIRLANAARAEWAEWAGRHPDQVARNKCPSSVTDKARTACTALDCALQAARLLARSAPPTARARRAAVRRLRQLWQCYCAAVEAALGLVQWGPAAAAGLAAARGARLLPDEAFGLVWGWHNALTDSPDVFRLLPDVAEEGREKTGQMASAAGGAVTASGAGDADSRPGPEAAALLSAGYVRLWTLQERACISLKKDNLCQRHIGRFHCWAEVLAFGPPGSLLGLLAVAAQAAREAPARGRAYVAKLREAAAAASLTDLDEEVTAMELHMKHTGAVSGTSAAARLLWTLRAAPALFAAGDSAGSAGGRASCGSTQPSPQPGEAAQQRRPHLEQLGLMWSVIAEHMLPCVAEGLICASAYPLLKLPGSELYKNYHTAATALLCCRLLLTALHQSEAGAAAAGARGVSSSSSSTESRGESRVDSSSSDAAMWRRLLLQDVDVCSLLAATAAIIRHDHQLPENGEREGKLTYRGGGGEDELGVDVRRACAELHSTAMLAAAVLPQECARAAQQGEGAAPGPEVGTQPPGRYRVPLAAESIAELFGSDGPCPSPQWQADVREAFTNASTTAGDGSQQQLSPEQLQACASRAQAAVQQQPDARQMQAAAALLVPPGRVRSALRRRYPGCRLWLCDNPACVPAAELDARGWPLPLELCSGAGAWVWCGGCESSLYCSDGCRLAHWEGGHAAVCRYCRGPAGQRV